MTPWILEPHNGDFGLSAWVICSAPTCLRAEITVPGSFAITAGERHFVDRQRHQHVHARCGLVMIRNGIATLKEQAA